MFYGTMLGYITLYCMALHYSVLRSVYIPLCRIILYYVICVKMEGGRIERSVASSLPREAPAWLPIPQNIRSGARRDDSVAELWTVNGGGCKNGRCPREEVRWGREKLRGRWIISAGKNTRRLVGMGMLRIGKVISVCGRDGVCDGGMAGWGARRHHGAGHGVIQSNLLAMDGVVMGTRQRMAGWDSRTARGGRRARASWSASGRASLG
jgi:hypothetical protein